MKTEFTNNQERSIASRYAKGETSTILAKEFDVSNATILRIVRSQGGEVRGRGRPVAA